MFSWIFYLSFFMFWCFCFKIMNIFVALVLGFWISIFLSLILVFVVLGLCMLFIRKLEPNHVWKHKIVLSISKFIIRFFRINVKVHNPRFIPLKGKMVVYANHKTNFDPFIIASIFPRTLTFTPKDVLYKGLKGLFLGFCFDATDCVKISRGNNRETVKNFMRMIHKIQQNLSILIFHEGGVTTTYTDKIIHSLDGAFQISLKSQANILPITLKGVYAIRGKCWFRKKQVEIFFHPIIPFMELKSKNTQQINQQVTDIINSVL
ncbi:lysophospholipid acyltransferase family protein [Candidatus Phytoplasma phoenicium]|uniref:1-acyl-sn-glycerol-3-phosphate acyltransferase n=1 Tax=Candidatus Phytoplasma phoenicium TaxID=198422 RepID=A0A0L0MK35_9MOLU|nr:lysophospholipid acyltransferase family protein [Candidatus Phytoplasma phoenicium]KND62655.1 1-acyl-sn-glycerol-3-phosphate acyltransferase [Candidatus Phytoplasma phoenicium]